MDTEQNTVHQTDTMIEFRKVNYQNNSRISNKKGEKNSFFSISLISIINYSLLLYLFSAYCTCKMLQIRKGALKIDFRLFFVTFRIDFNTIHLCYLDPMIFRADSLSYSSLSSVPLSICGNSVAGLFSSSFVENALFGQTLTTAIIKISFVRIFGSSLVSNSSVYIRNWILFFCV